MANNGWLLRPNLLGSKPGPRPAADTQAIQLEQTVHLVQLDGGLDYHIVEVLVVRGVEIAAPVLGVGDDPPPNCLGARQRLGVAQNPQAMPADEHKRRQHGETQRSDNHALPEKNYKRSHSLCPRQRDVGAVDVGEEADFAGFVAAHGGEDDHVLLRALEAVHGPHLHREQTPLVRRQRRPGDLLLDGADLAFVRRHHAHANAPLRVDGLCIQQTLRVKLKSRVQKKKREYLTERGTLTFEEPLKDADHGGGLDGVDEAPVMLARALVPAVDVDEGVGAVHWAAQVPPLVVSLEHVGAVGYPAVVEALDGELADPWVHPVLNVEEVLRLPQGCQPHEQASSKFGVLTNLYGEF